MASVKRDENYEPGIVAQNSAGTGVVFPTGRVLTDSTPQDVTIVDGNGDQITSFGGVSSPLFAAITANTSGVTNLVAAQAGKQIRVLQVVLVSNGAVNIKFQSHVTPTDLTGLFYLVANTGFSSGYAPSGQFQTVQGEALDINLSGNVAIGGYLTYTLI